MVVRNHVTTMYAAGKSTKQTFKMAQPQITDIFRSKKRGISEIHPSKRRKTVQDSQATELSDQPAPAENEIRSSLRNLLEKAEVQLPDLDVPQKQPNTPVRSSSRIKSTKTPTTRSRSKRSTTATPKAKAKSCKQISEFFSPSKLNNNNDDIVKTTSTPKKSDYTKPSVSPSEYFGKSVLL